MKRLIGTLVLIAAMVSIPAQASKVYGSGAGSCGKWTSDKAKASEGYRYDKVWLVGFVSGAGWGVGEDYEADADGMIGWVDNYCAANPLDDISDAAALVFKLRE